VPLQSRPFLIQLSAADEAALLDGTQRRQFARAERLLHVGAAGDDIAVVLSGTVRLVAYGVDGREVILGFRGPGDLIGEMAALGGQRRVATVLAADEGVEAAFMPAERFRDYLREHPDAAAVLIRTLVQRLTDATDYVVDLATQDSLGRIAKRLFDLSAAARDGEPVELVITQDELASWTGATRETVSRALRLMRSLGWVSTGNRTITVLDREGLRQRSGS
jgi:CRP/FNR family transcriptional regulator, cyclic AMP receptor protein